jgi:hypothetical protein
VTRSHSRRGRGRSVQAESGRLATGRHGDAPSGRLPNPTTLERLAAGLDLPLEVVRAAAAQAAGLVFDHQPVEDPETEALVASLARLSPADRRHVAALVRSLLGPAEPAATPTRQTRRPTPGVG